MKPINIRNNNELDTNKKYRVLFVCHGNICRSPMAEYVMKDLVRKEGLEENYEITSGAVSDEECGNPIYPPALRMLNENGIRSGKHRAHKITRQEFEDSDLVVVMDRQNLRRLAGIVGDFSSVPAGESLSKSGITGKVHLLMEFAGISSDVADPWYTGDFSCAFRNITAGCIGILEKTK